MGSPKESLKYYMEALTIAKNKKDSLLLSTRYGNLGIYYRKVNPSIAARSYKKSLLCISKERKGLDRIKTKYNLANVLYATGDFTKAEVVYQKMLFDCKAGNFKEATTIAYNGLASVYNQTNGQDLAIPYMLKAVQIADSLGMTNLALMLKPELISIYKKAGDYKKALVRAEQMKSLNDSIFSKEKQLEVHKLEIKYQTEQKAIENKQLLTNLVLRKNTIIVLTVLVIFSIGLVFRPTTLQIT